MWSRAICGLRAQAVPEPLKITSPSVIVTEACAVADEGKDEGGLRTVVDVVGRADLFDLALAHDDDAVGKLEGLFLVRG